MSTVQAARPSRANEAPATRLFHTDIEGLRAIAVFAVVAFHAGVPGFSGGFVGVDVFFVISGYLITGLLVREAQLTGKINFKAFYARRARRILPAASVALIATAVATWLILSPLAVYRAMQDIVSAALYFANWHFIGQGTDYLAASTDESVVLHFWSLGVEEQFYIFWPLLVLLAFGIARQFPLHSTRVVGIVLGAATLISFIYSLHITATNPGLAYMATTTRAWQFGVGGMLALITHWIISRRSRQPALARLGWGVGWIGVAALIYSVIEFNDKTAFPGWAAVVPTVGTAMVIAGGLLWGTTHTSIGAVLSWKPLRFIGRVSFSWYLLHWPVLILAEAKLGQLSWEVRSLLMVGALGLAILSYYLVEKPIMLWTLVRKRMSSAIALGVVCMIVSLSLALGLGTTVAKAMAATADFTAAEASFESVFLTKDGQQSGPVTPTPFDAINDLPRPDGCIAVDEAKLEFPCTVGNKGGKEVVLFGDSHAHQWLDAIAPIALARGWHLTVLAKTGCPVALLSVGGDDASTGYCRDFRANSIAQIVADKPELVLFASYASYTREVQEMDDAWATSLAKLRKSGSQFVYIRDTPKPTADVPACVSGALDEWSQCNFDFSASFRNESVYLGSLNGRNPDVKILDLTRYLCVKTDCQAVINGVLVYRDDSHLTATIVRALAPAFDQGLVTLGVVEALPAKATAKR